MGALCGAIADVVERLFAWLHHFRWLVIRWEYHLENFFGMVRLACIKILLRQIEDQC
jgi:transposase